MITKSGILAVVEQAYSREADDEAWLFGIREAAGAAFDGHLAVQVYTFEVSSGGSVKLGTLAGDQRDRDLMQVWHEAADEDDIRAAYASGPITRMSQVMARSKNPRLRAVSQANIAATAALDIVAAVGVDPSGHGCAMSFVRTQAALSAPTRSALGRLSAHLASAYRLRRGSAAVEAAFTPRGEVAEQSKQLSDESANSLRRAALAIDRAHRAAPASPDAALGYWKAMVEGRWTLVERFEADGRRILVARENEPGTRHLTALSSDQAKVVALAALGRPSKSIAYELGFLPSKVSRLLASSLDKLGLRSPAQLVELHGLLRK